MDFLKNEKKQKKLIHEETESNYGILMKLRKKSSELK